MQSHLFRSSIAALLLIVVNVSRGAQQADDVIAPFVGPDTLVVVRGDLDRIDENALADLLIQTVKEPQLDKPQRDMLRRWWKRWSDIGDGPMSDFRDAGVKRAYWVLTLQDFINPNKPTGTWVFPIEEATDAQKLIDVSRKHKLEPQRIGDVVVAGQPGQSVAGGSAAPLPAVWAHALAAGGDAPLRFAIVPTTILRRSFEENLPSLSTPTGPIPITILTHGIEWVGVSVTLAPNPRIAMVTQTPDAPAAHAIAEFLGRTLPEVRAQMPRIPPFILTPADLAALLKPEVVGDQLRWEPNFQRVLTPLIAREVIQGVRVHSAANIRQILQGFAMYGNNHKGETPPELNALIKYEEMSPEVLIDPLNPGEKVGFVYVRPKGDWEEQAQDWAVLYETAPQGFNVGFADGHVEWFGTRQAVEEQVKIAESRNAAATKPAK